MRRADDHAREPRPSTRRRERAQVVERRRRRRSRSRAGRPRRARPRADRGRGPVEHAVAVDVGDDQRTDAGAVEAPRQLDAGRHRWLASSRGSRRRGPERRARPRPDRGADVASSSTTSGCSTAALPITTRATPAANRSLRVRRPSARRHRVWTRARRRSRRSPRSRARFASPPSRAASRSTTWIQRAPAASKSRATATGSSS